MPLIPIIPEFDIPELNIDPSIKIIGGNPDIVASATPAAGDVAETATAAIAAIGQGAIPIDSIAGRLLDIQDQIGSLDKIIMDALTKTYDDTTVIGNLIGADFHDALGTSVGPIRHSLEALKDNLQEIKDYISQIATENGPIGIHTTISEGPFHGLADAVRNAMAATGGEVGKIILPETVVAEKLHDLANIIKNLDEQALGVVNHIYDDVEAIGKTLGIDVHELLGPVSGNITTSIKDMESELSELQKFVAQKVAEHHIPVDSIGEHVNEAINKTVDILQEGSVTANLGMIDTARDLALNAAHNLPDIATAAVQTTVALNN
ncbi:hypothetical protein NEOKW01_1862 [Nematocida sp. AWRm80]|nr:hypothetical protein NEOKW01_1862 [Nematocida sp. AWRm80]